MENSKTNICIDLSETSLALNIQCVYAHNTNDVSDIEASLQYQLRLLSKQILSKLRNQIRKEQKTKQDAESEGVESLAALGITKTRLRYIIEMYLEDHLEEVQTHKNDLPQYLTETFGLITRDQGEHSK